MTVATLNAPEVAHAATDTADLAERVSVRKLDFFYGDSRALKAISLPLYDRMVTTLMGGRCDNPEVTSSSMVVSRPAQALSRSNSASLP